MVSITESGVNFGDFSEEDLYKIEHSQGHLSLGEGFKMVEFTYIRNSSLFVIEAKSSFPRASNKEDYDKFWNEIFEKFENALLLQLMGCLQRNDIVMQELPNNHKQIQWNRVSIKLRLVIPSVPSEFLGPLTESFRQKIHKIKILWKIPNEDIFVLNKELALKENLITES